MTTPHTPARIMRRGVIKRLTPRQAEVLSLVADGWSNRSIADELGISVRTVEAAMSDVIAALDIPGDTDGYNARVMCVLTYLTGKVAV